MSSVPSSEKLIDRLSNNPNLQRWATEREQRQAALDLELSKRVPDVTVKGGYRRFEETDDHAFIFGISVPLQLFDRNQGAIAEARNKLIKVVSFFFTEKVKNTDGAIALNGAQDRSRFLH